MKKLLFPFFNKNKHGFLKTKLWFRAITVVFIIIFILAIPNLWITQINEVYNHCKTESNKLSGLAFFLDDDSINYNSINYNDALSRCNDLERKAWTSLDIIQYSLINPIIIFYLSQLFFFKIIINYIVLGNQKNK